jgi:ribosomal protein S1
VLSQRPLVLAKRGESSDEPGQVDFGQTASIETSNGKASLCNNCCDDYQAKDIHPAIETFLPWSEMNKQLTPKDGPGWLEIDVLIITFEVKRKNVVVSCKALLPREPGGRGEEIPL